jgi:hypothetical protein
MPQYLQRSITPLQARRRFRGLPQLRQVALLSSVGCLCSKVMGVWG